MLSQQSSKFRSCVNAACVNQNRLVMLISVVHLAVHHLPTNMIMFMGTCFILAVLAMETICRFILIDIKYKACLNGSIVF